MNILESRLDAVPMEINSSEHLRKDKEQNGAEIFRIGKVNTKDILTNLLVYKEDQSALETIQTINRRRIQHSMEGEGI